MCSGLLFLAGNSQSPDLYKSSVCPFLLNEELPETCGLSVIKAVNTLRFSGNSEKSGSASQRLARAPPISIPEYYASLGQK